MTEESPKKQPLWPLFTLATLLGVFGFAMAFYGPVRASSSLEVESPASTSFRVERKDDPISPVFVLEPAAYKFFIFQKTIRGETTLQSRMSFDVADTVSDSKIRRSFSNVRIEMGTTSDTSMEVARLIETLEFELEFGPNGKLKSQTVISAEAGQLARVVEIIKSAQYVLAPSFPGGPIGPKREWTDVLNVKPTQGMDEELYDLDEIPKVSGHLAVKRRFAGTDADHGFIKQTVTQSVLVEDDPTPSARVSGAGLAIVKKSNGAVVNSRFNIQTSFKKSEENVAIATELLMQRVP